MKSLLSPGRWLLMASLLFSEVGATAQSFVNFEGKQTAPARLSPDGSRLFVVNTPDNRLSVFDVSKLTKLCAVAPTSLKSRLAITNQRPGDNKDFM